MNDILHRIAANKRVEVEQLKIERPLDRVTAEITERPPHRFKAALQAGGEDEAMNIIGEIKRGSPSRGVLSTDFNPARLARQYRDGGAAALSVLTDQAYFYGRHEYMGIAAHESGLPVLCKDFVLDRYQLYYARSMEADAVLLIVKLLPPDMIREFLGIAAELGLDCLVEAHDSDEVKTAVDCGAEIVGVNNRDLTTFEVTLETSERLGPAIPKGVIKVAESGIFDREHITRLQQAGYNCFLIGEALVTTTDPVGLLKRLRGVETADSKEPE